MKLKLLFITCFFTITSVFSQTLDQSHSSGSSINSSTNETNPLGQSFTAGITGNLSHISLKLGDTGAFSPGTFQLRIYDGNGYGGTLLNTTLLDITSTTSGSTDEVMVALSTSVPVTSGSMYTIDFRGLGSAIINFHLTFGGYSGGGYFFDNGDTGLYNTYDVWFKTFVTIPVPATHLNFDGIDDRANTNNSSLPFGNSTRTVEAWVKTNTTTTGTIVNYGNQSSNQRFGLLVLGSGELYVVGEFNDYNAGGTLNDNNWHHVAVSFNGSTLTTYINGVNVGSTTTTYATTGSLLGIGASYRTSSWGEHLNGNIDEVRIWNTARSQSEIQDKMNCELMGNETGLVSYYKFNQGNGAANNSTETTAADSSTSANNAALNNMALNGTTSNWLAGSAVATGNICATLSTANFNLSNDVKIYPNPTQNRVTILNGINEKGLINVYDINGRLLKTERLNSKTQIELSSFQSGVYLFEIQTEFGVTTKQVVKY